MIELERRLSGARATGRSILSVYLTAGLPSPDRFPLLVREIADAGADIVEVGVPFSDPLADGPVIQASHSRALRLGVTCGSVLGMVGEIRKCTVVPIILMGYANPFLSFGLGKFIAAAASAGVSGMIVPDLPPDEGADYAAIAARCGIASVFLAAPTTPDERIVEIDRISTGFVYAVTTLGVTGMREGAAAEVFDFLDRARVLVARNPLLAGFGVSDPATARAVAGRCDGVIVGSAVVSRLSDPDGEAGARRAIEFVAELRRALDVAA